MPPATVGPEIPTMRPALPLWNGLPSAIEIQRRKSSNAPPRRHRPCTTLSPRLSSCSGPVESNELKAHRRLPPTSCPSRPPESSLGCRRYPNPA